MTAASGGSLACLGRAKGMSPCRGARDGGARAPAPRDSPAVLRGPGRWLQPGDSGHPHGTDVHGTT